MADAKKIDTEIVPMTGEKVQEVVMRSVSMPPDLVKRAREAIK